MIPRIIGVDIVLASPKEKKKQMGLDESHGKGGWEQRKKREE